MVEEKLVALEKVHTDQNGSDMLTKILPKSKIEVCRLKAGLVEPPHVGVRGRFVGFFPPTWRKGSKYFIGSMFFSATLVFGCVCCNGSKLV